MVNQIPTLPHEVWALILNQIHNTRQLAKCRLVCKQWNLIAERAMFCETLFLQNSESFVTRLYYHLSKRPALGLCIKDIYMHSFSTQKAIPLYNELLKLVMTPSLEQLWGGFPSKETEQMVYQIILNSPHKFKKIKQIPDGTEGNLRPECLYALRESLVSVYMKSRFGLSNLVLDHLDEFCQLKTLALAESNLRDISQIDSILCRLQCATGLRLGIDWTEESDATRSKDQMNAWLSENVNKDERMQSVLCGTLQQRNQTHWCNLIEYYVYKYPNLQCLIIDGVILNSDIDRIFEATRQIPSFVLQNSVCNRADHLLTVGSQMRSPTNTISIRYWPDLEEDAGACLIEKAYRWDNSKNSKFKIKLQSETPHTYIKQLLSSVGSGTTVITKALVDLVHWRDQDNFSNLLTFYDVLKLIPTVRNLEFSDAIIRHQETGSGDLLLRDLKTLEILGARIDHRVLTQISSIAPNLEQLFISSSLVFGREQKFAIVMPHSNLSGLVLRALYCDWDRDEGYLLQRSEMRDLRWNDKRMGIDEETLYLCIKTELFPAVYCLLKPDGQINTVITEEEYKLHALAFKTIYIECKSLSSLSFDVDNLNMTMQFENGVLKSESPFEESYYLKMEKTL